MAEIRVSGKKAVRKTFSRMTDAKGWISNNEASVKSGEYARRAKSEKYTFGEMVEAYIDLHPQFKVRECQLNWWKQKLGDELLADIRSSDIVELKEELSRTNSRFKRPYSNATVNRYLAALSHCYSKAWEKEWISVHPMIGKKVTRMPESADRDRFLSDAERNRLLAACQASNSPNLYPLVVLALSTGARAGELTGLRWADVDLQRGMAVLHHTKNKEKRALAIKGLAHSLLIEFSKVRRIDSGLVFPGSDGQKPWPYRKAWIDALTKAEVTNFRFHDLRHTCASYLAMNGATTAEIAAVLGHKTLAMVKRYSHLADSHVADVVERMNQKVLG